MGANLFARVALPFSLVAALAILAWTQADTFVPQKNVPGPTRVHGGKADNSAAVTTDILFSADRLAIINHITAYGYLIDKARWEDWYALFSDDVNFEINTPTLGSVIINGKTPLRAFVEERYIKGAESSTAVRSHFIGNMQVVSQTAMTANVRSYLHLSSVRTADNLNILTAGTYNANLKKLSGKWIITRLHIEGNAPFEGDPVK